MALGFSISGGLDTVPMVVELRPIHRFDRRTIRSLAKVAGWAGVPQPTREDLGSFAEPHANSETHSIAQVFVR